MSLLAIADELSEALRKLRFSRPVTHVYNPLEYAREVFAEYASRFGAAGKEAVLVGMNPGPWGMAQTGVPFGEVGFVRDWLGIDGEVTRPAREHPKRPVEGFACARSAPTVHASLGMCWKGSYWKCRVVFCHVILWMSSSETPASEAHSVSGAVGQVESECG